MLTFHLQKPVSWCGWKVLPIDVAGIKADVHKA